CDFTTYILCSYPVIFLSSLILRLPRFTLFPYTTLFRSLTRLQILLKEQKRLPSPGDWGPIGSVDTSRTAARGHPDWFCRPVPTGDRKSTRLNSSHVKISYAVFCLKKKKTTDSSIKVT